MIRKTLYLCLGVVVATVLSLNACTTKVEASANDAQLRKQQHELELKRLREQQKSVWETELADASRFTLDLKLNDREKRVARKFARTVTHNLKTNDIYVHYLLTKLKENNIPLEIAAIPLLESGLNPRVHHAGAHGAWQYMRGTSSSLGLKKTKNYDGVYDFFASTDAGIKYLNHLYKDLGSWKLVVVAYNQGEYGIKRAVNAAKKRGDPAPTVHTIRIAKSTRNYLVRFKAYSDVLKHPQEYGVKLPVIKNRPAFRRVEIADKVTSLNEVARLSGATVEVLKKLNSGYTTDKIDPYHGIKIPIDHVETLEKAISSNGDNKTRAKRVDRTPLKLTFTN